MDMLVVEFIYAKYHDFETFHFAHCRSRGYKTRRRRSFMFLFGMCQVIKIEPRNRQSKILDSIISSKNIAPSPTLTLQKNPDYIKNLIANS